MTTPPTRTVRVIDREAERRFWGTSAHPYLPIPSVTLPWVCPVCGGPRGEPYNYNFCEDGSWYSCDRWENPCGHIDRYADVLARLQAQA